MSPLSNRLPTNSCLTGKFDGSLVHLLMESGLHPFKNWEPTKLSSCQCSAALGTSPMKLVNACKIYWLELTDLTYIIIEKYSKAWVLKQHFLLSQVIQSMLLTTFRPSIRFSCELKLWRVIFMLQFYVAVICEMMKCAKSFHDNKTWPTESCIA